MRWWDDDFRAALTGILARTGETSVDHAVKLAKEVADAAQKMRKHQRKLGGSDGDDDDDDK